MRTYFLGLLLAGGAAAATAAAPVSAPAAVIAAPGGCEPLWATSSIRNQEFGATDMLVLVKPDGQAAEARIVNSSGFRDLDRTAMGTAAKCRYVPASVDGMARESWFQLRLERNPETFKRPQVQGDIAACGKPTWPKEARRNGYQGTVLLAFLIGVDGSVRESRIDQSSGYDMLDLAAQEAIARCKFKPATQDGQLAETWVKLHYRWSLTEPSQSSLQEQLVKVRAAAQAGAPESQHKLGLMYLNGQGTPVDRQEARKWLQLAADQGLASAQEAMGMLLAPRANAPGDPALAQVWLRKAAEQGRANSQYVLGAMLRKQGKQEDAEYWLLKAAEQNHPAAQTALALSLMSTNLPQDIVLLNKAVGQDERTAQVTLAQCYENGRGVAQNYTLAATLYRRAAVANNRTAQLALARLYQNGLGVPQDEAKARQLLQQANAPK